MKMPLSNNKTAQLWQKFIPMRTEIMNKLNADFISMQKYGENWDFSPASLFEKWAAVKVLSFAEIPSNMETYLLKGGKYAVFVHHGPGTLAHLKSIVW